MIKWLQMGVALSGSGLKWEWLAVRHASGTNRSIPCGAWRSRIAAAAAADAAAQAQRAFLCDLSAFSFALRVRVRPHLR